MAIDPEFDEMMNDICLFRAGTAIDAYGKRTYGTALSVEGRLMYEDMEIRTEEGRIFHSVGKFLTYGPLLTVTLKDRLTLPDNTEAIILGIDQVTDEDGDYYTSVRFGR